MRSSRHTHSSKQQPTQLSSRPSQHSKQQRSNRLHTQPQQPILLPLQLLQHLRHQHTFLMPQLLQYRVLTSPNQLTQQHQ